MAKPKLLPIPTLLLLLLFLLLATCHILSLLRLSTGGPPSPPPSRRIPTVHHNFPITARRTRKLKSKKPKFKSLSNASFSTRINHFFPNCSTRFFMTWISPLRTFRARELFAVESLFRAHADACLVILSQSLDSPAGRRLLGPFKKLKICVLAPDFKFLLRNTPGEDWFAMLKNGQVDPGQVPIGQNLSNLLRLAVLYKYGGVYIDTDVIVLKSVSGLRNVIGAQAVDPVTGNWTRLNNAVMVFDRKHPILLEFIEEFARTFDGSRWGHNGPYLVSRVAMRVRDGFEVLPPAAFYPVDWNRIGRLFCGPRDGMHTRWASLQLRTIRERSFAVHLWNRQSSGLEVEEGSVIRRIMADCCLFCNSSARRIIL